eukprot:1447257-Amphidinium_carterae.1
MKWLVKSYKKPRKTMKRGRKGQKANCPKDLQLVVCPAAQPEPEASEESQLELGLAALMDEAAAGQMPTEQSAPVLALCDATDLPVPAPEPKRRRAKDNVKVPIAQGIRRDANAEPWQDSPETPDKGNHQF